MDDMALRATIGLSVSEFNQLAQSLGPETEKEFYYHQHIRYGLTLLPFGTLLPSVTTSYMLGTLYAIAFIY
uniref:Uncharacterized protein n=1 Tax=Candidatus Methanophaga sp. ANME-1 ERB7 TaxID=2759913 RepID=A0A7G9Z5H2_9EURY|nr:hypothetical protein BHOFGHMF_00023 [Methanosarcinales archaeon ANME-1 ERB7]